MTVKYGSKAVTHSLCTWFRRYVLLLVAPHGNESLPDDFSDKTEVEKRKEKLAQWIFAIG